MLYNSGIIKLSNTEQIIKESIKIYNNHKVVKNLYPLIKDFSIVMPDDDFRKGWNM